MNKVIYLFIAVTAFVSCKTNQPGPPVKGETEKIYYIYQGKRISPKQFDQEWLKNNCDIKETVVY